MQDKSCGCKGCRSCLVCESSKPEDRSAVKLKIFHYSPSLKKCLTYHQHACVGFDFPGVTIIENFITEKEESELAKHIDSFPWKDSQSGRRKQDYGPKVNFKKQKIRLSSFNGLPSYIRDATDHMKNFEELKDFNIVEQCNLEYVPERGSQIDPHFDDSWLWGERLVTLNLLSDTLFTMTSDCEDLCKLQSFPGLEPHDIERENNSSEEVDADDFNNIFKRGIAVKIPLKQRSLVVLSGPARHEWKHAIQRSDITTRRLCCTFRELSGLFCNGGDNYSLGKELIEIASSYKGNVVL